MNKVITIELDASGEIKVTPDSQELGSDDEAVWAPKDDGAKFQVRFKNGKTPFANGQFDENNPRSGKPKVTVTQPTAFAYEVRYRNKVLDPDVVIKPSTR